MSDNINTYIYNLKGMINFCSFLSPLAVEVGSASCCRSLAFGELEVLQGLALKREEPCGQGVDAGSDVSLMMALASVSL